MKNIFNIIVFFGLSMCFLGCASSEVKAPCDYQAHFCGSKVKINQW